MKSSIILGGMREAYLYQDDILVVTTEGLKNNIMKEVKMVSVVALRIRFTDSSSLIRKVIENNSGVAVWRANRIVKILEKNQEIPTEEIYTHHFLLIQESFRAYGTIPNFFYQKTCQRLLTKRTRVLSTFSTGFDHTILTKEKLKDVYFDKELVKESCVKVPVDIEYLRSVAEQERVPQRDIPPLPYSTEPVKISLGKLFINSQKIVGLNKLPRVIVFGGSDRTLLIGSLQHFVKSLQDSERKILIIDIDNELGGLSKEPFQTNLPVTTWQLGRNFHLNLCSVEVPSDLTETDNQLAYRSNVLSHILAFASENHKFITDIPQLQLKLAKALKNLPVEDQSLDNIVKSEEFSELLDLDQTTLERLVAALKLYTEYPELNHLRFNQEYDHQIGITKGITVFQFPYQSVYIKRAVSAFLLQKIALRCDLKTIVIIINAAQLFHQILSNNEIMRIFEEAIGQYYNKIIQSGSIVLATYSIKNLPIQIQKDINTGIFFKFINAEDREWISLRYALERKLENVNAFLQSIDGEGLLFREDSPHTCDHFIPFVLNTVRNDVMQLTEKTLIPSPPIPNLPDELFVILMTVLGLIRKSSLKKNELFRNLQAAGFMLNYIEPNWHILQHSPYLDILDKVSDQIISITPEGKKFYDNLQSIIQQIPPALEYEPKELISVLTNLKRRGYNTKEDETETYQQLVQDTCEFAGSLLNGLFQVQGRIDWKLFKIYLELLNVQNYTAESQSQRLDLLETIFTKTIER